MSLTDNFHTKEGKKKKIMITSYIKLYLHVFIFFV